MALSGVRLEIIGERNRYIFMIFPRNSATDKRGFNSLSTPIDMSVVKIRLVIIHPVCFIILHRSQMPVERHRGANIYNFPKGSYPRRNVSPSGVGGKCQESKT
jgi:hypothetical protein